jgi:predicted transcriptional regulator
MSLLSVSKKWSCSDSGLQKLLRRNEVVFRPIGASVSRRKISPEQEAEVVRLHVDERMSAEKISKLYGCSAPSVRSVLRRNNINDPIPQSREPHIDERAIKPDQEQIVTDLYNGGMSTPKIAKLFGCSNPAVIKVLKRNNVPVGKKYSYRKYSLREDMFDVIDTEEKAYWLGFVYAEGCVNKKMTTLSIELSFLDHDHLVKFRDTISPGKPISTPVRTSNWKGLEKTGMKSIISIWSKKLSLSLHDIGISKERQEPDRMFSAIPDELFHHFVRGYFDGDGNARKTNPRISFIGEERLLRWIERNLDSNLNIGEGREIYFAKNKRKLVGSIYFSGRTLAARVSEFMYRDATIYLERKKEIVDSW